jgi:SAM-dependent methyltransferase
MNSVQDEYEQVPYADFAQPLSDPSRLAAIARLFGVKAADPRACRVLELGCGQGTNLLSLAERLPASQFLGLDFSAPQIAAGQAALGEADLKNIELRREDLLTWQPEGGKFDFIICYGVFSWVPDAVKQGILELCRLCLAPDGVACISYATYPGAKQDEALRDLLRLHAQGFSELTQRVNAAQAVLGFLERAYAVIKTPDALSWGHHVRGLKAKEPNLFFHDDLGRERDPCYLLQFTDWAFEHGLQYICDSEPRRMLVENLPTEIAAELASLKLNRLLTEQFLDFVANRRFRISLLTHRETVLVEGIEPQAIRHLCLSTILQRPPASHKSRRMNPGEAEFRTPSGSRTKARGLPLVALLRVLVAAAPARKPFADVLAAAQDQAQRKFTIPEIEQLCRDLLSLYARGQLDLWAVPLEISRDIPEHPRLSPLSRALARSRGFLVSAFQAQVPLQDEDRKLAVLLNGTLDLEQLRASVAGRHLSLPLDSTLQRWAVSGCLTNGVPTCSPSLSRTQQEKEPPFACIQ